MKIDRDSFLSQGLWMRDRRIWTDNDRLARDGSAEIDDTPTDGGVMRAPDLAPFTGVEGCRGLFFKRGMPPEGIHLHRIGFRRAVRGPLPCPEKLYLDAFCSKQTLFLRYEPWKIEDRLTVLVRHFLHQIPPVPVQLRTSAPRISGTLWFGTNPFYRIRLICTAVGEQRKAQSRWQNLALRERWARCFLGRQRHDYPSAAAIMHPRRDIGGSLSGLHTALRPHLRGVASIP